MDLKFIVMLILNVTIFSRLKEIASCPLKIAFFRKWKIITESHTRFDVAQEWVHNYDAI